MWCWNRCITETTLGRTSAELELSLPAFLPVFLPQSPPPNPLAFSSFDQFLRCTYGILPDNLNLICFPSCLILVSWCSPEVRHWWQLSYRICTHNPVPLLSFFSSCERKDGQYFFFTHPSTSHNVVFVSFWQFRQTSALREWQAISQTTKRVAAKGNKLGPTLRFSPGRLTSSGDSVSHVLIKIS